MRFVGEDECRIGSVDKPSTPDEDKRGRCEVFTLPDDEDLLGCEIDCNKFYTFGVRWLTFKFDN